MHAMSPSSSITRMSSFFFATFLAWICENSRPIIEERHEMERARAEELSKSAPNDDDYTSLYWNPGKDSENDYEVVDQENCSRYFGSGILRGIKESLLRELRRDLARFARPIVYRSGRQQKHVDSTGKCVNLRPGLALGVITLQAGSRQRITVH